MVIGFGFGVLGSDPDSVLSRIRAISTGSDPRNLNPEPQVTILIPPNKSFGCQVVQGIPNKPPGFPNSPGGPKYVLRVPNSSGGPKRSRGTQKVLGVPKCYKSPKKLWGSQKISIFSLSTVCPCYHKTLAVLTCYLVIMLLHI